MQKNSFLSKFITNISRIGTGGERDYVIENLSILVASGMTVGDALNGIEKEIHSRAMRGVINELRADIDAGSPVWKALSNTGIFSAHTISLVRIGEESGRLSENLKLVSEQQRKERIFKSRIRSAMMYPIFVLGLTAVVGTGIAWFILPKLATVFSQLNVKLPLITKILIASGEFLGKHGVVVVPIAVVIMVTFLYLLFFARRTKYIGQTIIFSIPAIRRLLLETELTRFGYILGTLLKAGVPMSQALLSLSDVTDFPLYRRFYEYLAQSVQDGNSFERSFKGYKKLNKLIPVPAQLLISSGERSGSLSDSLLTISRNYEERAETTTKDLSVILEPILLVIVWLGVVGVALAVILPIYSLIGNLNVSS